MGRSIFLFVLCFLSLASVFSARFFIQFQYYLLLIHFHYNEKDKYLNLIIFILHLFSPFDLFVRHHSMPICLPIPLPMYSIYSYGTILQLCLLAFFFPGFHLNLIEICLGIIFINKRIDPIFIQLIINAFFVYLFIYINFYSSAT